jgi:hypothetical protein
VRGETRIDGEPDLHDGILARPPAPARAGPSWLLLGAAVAAAYAFFGPAEVNGDGIGYLKAARDGVLYPGHVAYVPLLALCGRIARTLGLTDGTLRGLVVPGRLLSAISIGIATAALATLVDRRSGDRSRALVAALGLAASAGVVLVGTDVESYAPALAALALALVCLDRGQAAAAGACVALAAQLHVENLLFFAPALAWTPAGTRARLLLAAAPIVAVGAAVSLHLGGLHGATHGFSYPLHLYTPLVAVWGACRALVYAPYLYEAASATVVMCSAAGAVAALALALLAWAGHRAGRRCSVPSAARWAWALPYAAVGALFFASDSERWLFLLPLAWITVAELAAPRRLARVVAAIALANLAAWGPRACDRRGIERARSVATQLAPGDLVIGPGHGWDESIPLYRDGVVPFPLVFHAAAGGAAALPARLDQAVAVARGRGAHVRVVRVDDADDPSGPLGYKELAGLGVDRAAVRALLAGRGLLTSP